MWVGVGWFLQDAKDFSMKSIDSFFVQLTISTDDWKERESNKEQTKLISKMDKNSPARKNMLHCPCNQF